MSDSLDELAGHLEVVEKCLREAERLLREAYRAFDFSEASDQLEADTRAFLGIEDDDDA